ncbi:hypothetical protein K402DRAFT_13879 [Aulographum hederae CBS 113979]|uniref:Uncharacterized protein n=1 Tax=Aulographum hederae CBS 113979 TaxID=1176131 RepID=A0A6G1H7A5_9PEZI|nr:hypothetical protein K402DRAFT_13879 [Aulographum hederae CBS 113979]
MSRWLPHPLARFLRRSSGKKRKSRNDTALAVNSSSFRHCCGCLEQHKLSRSAMRRCVPQRDCSGNPKVIKVNLVVLSLSSFACRACGRRRHIKLSCSNHAWK